MIIGTSYDPDEITAASGVVPAKVWRPGELVHERGTRRHQTYGWQVDSGLDPSALLAEHITALLSQLAPGWEYLSQLGTRLDTYVECVIYMRDAQGPLTAIPKDALRRIAELNTELGFDLYCLPRTKDPDG